MTLFIKAWATFATVAAYDLISYDLCLDSLDGSAGSCTVVGSAPRTYAGSWAVLDGQIYLIDAVSPQTDSSILTLLSPLEAFGRSLLYTAPSSGTSIGAFIASQISLWITETDGVYACPYLAVSNSDTSTFVAPDVDSGGLFTITDYVETVRASYGVNCLWSISSSGLVCTIAKRQPGTEAVVLNDGHSQLLSAAYSRKGPARLTLIQGTTSYDYYLAKDGSVSSSVPAQRAEGSWEVQSIGTNDNPLDKAVSIFAKNSESHKIEFYSDRDMAVNDRINIRVYGELLSSVLAYKGQKSTDNRYYYRSGELATTAAEKLRRVT